MPPARHQTAPHSSPHLPRARLQRVVHAAPKPVDVASNHVRPARLDPRGPARSRRIRFGATPGLGAVHLGSGDRYWGQVRGFSGRLKALRGRDASDRRSGVVAGKTPQQALFLSPLLRRESSMVRRGSTVRVRQRAYQKRRKSALFLSRTFARSPVCGAYGAPLWGPQVQSARSKASEVGALAGKARLHTRPRPTRFAPVSGSCAGR
jgi:hypothetical protein